MTSASALAFTLYWRDPLLAQDFSVLVTCGRVQASARAAGHDTPAGFFLFAANTYPPWDAQSVLARIAMNLTATRLALEVPS